MPKWYLSGKIVKDAVVLPAPLHPAIIYNVFAIVQPLRRKGTIFFSYAQENGDFFRMILIFNGRSCLPCTALPYSRTAAYPRGVRHSMFALSPQCGDTSGASLGVRSVALLHLIKRTF